MNTTFDFYFPCGGGDLKTANDIFDYFKNRNFTGVVSCREATEFRAYLSYENGTYWLTMFDCDNYDETNGKYFIGHRMTEKRKIIIVELMEYFIRQNC